MFTSMWEPFAGRWGRRRKWTPRTGTSSRTARACDVILCQCSRKAQVKSNLTHMVIAASCQVFSYFRNLDQRAIQAFWPPWPTWPWPWLFLAGLLACGMSIVQSVTRERPANVALLQSIRNQPSGENGKTSIWVPIGAPIPQSAFFFTTLAISQL